MEPNDIYNKICEFSPNNEQTEIFRTLTDLDISKNPLLIRLPCGYGKTESVIIPFLNQTISKKWSLAPRVIYVLPTRALCNQIRDRINCYSQRIEKLTGKKVKVEIEHGVSSLDPLFFSDICITTFDQFLYGYARTKQQIGRHFDLPAGSIANSVIVFDEAHLYSPYTHSLMRAMIEILVSSRIPVIIMTATMPESLQKDLMKGIDNNQQTISFNGSWFKNMRKRNIKWHIEEWGFLKDGKITEKLDDILLRNKNKKILIVVNRIDTAQKLTYILQDRLEFISLIHSRFTVKDRAKKEQIVCECFGKNRNEQRPGIIISTQVCEVGLDISCDILITECASADALLQRAGRVARWGGNGEVVIVRPMNNDSWIDDDLWNEAFPYVDRKKGDESQYGEIKKGEFAGITWEYLKKDAPQKLFTDWSAMTAFCNMMDYHTDDVEARGALGQLFDSTLYADDRPWNLSARGDLYCTLAVISRDTIAITPSSEEIVTKKQKKKSQKKKDQVAQIPYAELRKCCLNLPFRYLISKDTTKLRQYDFVEGMAGNELDKARVRPFQTYLIDPSEHYDSHIGLTVARKEKAQETEEASSCLII